MKPIGIYHMALSGIRSKILTEGWTNFCTICGGNHEAHDAEAALLAACPWAGETVHPVVHNLRKVIVCAACRNSRAEHDMDAARRRRGVPKAGLHRFRAAIVCEPAGRHLRGAACGKSPEDHRREQEGLESCAWAGNMRIHPTPHEWDPHEPVA